jgi:hypothetical protein
MARGGRRWSLTNLRFSLSSMEEFFNIFRCEAAMEAERERERERAFE